MEQAGHCCHSSPTPEQGLPPLGRKLKILCAIFLAVLAISFAPPFEALNHSLL
jgi:hypothetical protein